MAKPTHVEIGPVWIDVSISETHTVGAEVTDHPVEDGPGITDNIRPTPRTIRIEGLVTQKPLELPLTHAGTAAVNTEPGYIVVSPSPLHRIPPTTTIIKGEPTTYGLGIIPGFDQAAALAGAITGALGLPTTLPRREYAHDLHTVDKGSITAMPMQGLRFTQEFDRVRSTYDALCSVVELGEPVQLITGLEVYDAVAIADLTFDRSQEHGPKALYFTATCKVLRIVTAETVAVPAEQRGKAGTSSGKQTTADTSTASLSDPAKEQARQSFARVVKTVGINGLIDRYKKAGLEGLADLFTQ